TPAAHEKCADTIVGECLPQRSRTAGAPIFEVFPRSALVVVGVVEGAAVHLHGQGAQDGVVQHALHAIPVPTLARGGNQATNKLEMAIGAAGCLETRVTGVERLTELAGSRMNECLVRAPAPRGEALRLDEPEAVFRCL